MSLRALTCPQCGAPLPRRALRVVVACEYCGAKVADTGRVVEARGFRDALAERARDDAGTHPRVEIGGVPYRVLGRVARGESTDVFLAERAHRVTERVLIKVLRAAEDADLQGREWEALAALHRSDAAGAEDGLRRISTPVIRGNLVAGASSAPRRAVVVLARSGFVDTFDDVMRAYPGGVDARHAVWMWRRILEALAWVHRSGWAHGAVLPQHLVVHARDHGVMLVGWSCAARLADRAPLPAVAPAARDLYPPALLAGAPITAATDLAMSARAVARVLGGTADRAPKTAPAPIAEIVDEHAAGRGGDDAWALGKRVAAAARQVYGPPAYHPFPMPGWRI
jgi:hypothetical protein